jgi:pyruvate ferredoxin oxidoreductase beta subunit
MYMARLLESGHTMCAGCGVAVAVNMLSRACPDDTIVCCATSCLEVTTSAYPQTAWNSPWIHNTFETVSATASGVEAAVRRLKKPWKVLAIAGDGGTHDIGLQGLSGMLERGHRVTQVCVDNECYANTGVQRSSATPYGAWTTFSPIGRESFGKGEWKKPICEIAAAHHIPYVASASIGYPQDLYAKVRKALERQPSFLHIMCPCPTGWRFDTSLSVKLSRLAVEAGMWVLYEIEDGRLRLTKKVKKRRPVEEYLMLQGRFKHLKEPQLRQIQEHTNSEYQRLLDIEKADIRL